MSYTFVELAKDMIADAADIGKTYADHWNYAQLLSELESDNGYLFAAFDGEKLCGVCGMQCAADEGSLNTITVAPACLGKGVGKALLKYAIEHCPAHTFYLEVRCNNAAAIGLYQSIGFTPCGKRKGFYTSPDDDAIVMNLILNHGE